MRFLKHFLGALVLALALMTITAAPAAAQYVPVNGMPKITVPNYNVDASIWAFDMSIIGQAGGIFEKTSSGLWYKFGGPDPSDLYATVMAAGGYHAYVINVLLPNFNAALKQRYPAIGGGPSSSGNTTIDDLNAEMFYALAFKVNADGTVSLYPK